MRIFRKILIPLFALSIAGCGGSVSGVGDRDAGPGSGDDGGPVNPNCPAKGQVNQGYACSLSGIVCPSSHTSVDCQGSAKNLACFCDGESWTCEQAAPLNCPTATCPAPQAIYQGDDCLSAGIGSACASTNILFTACGSTANEPSITSGTCTCTNSGWSCPVSEPPCAIMPMQGVCPDPSSVYPFEHCSAGPLGSEPTNLVCPGNPQYCDGLTYYDTFQCEGYWLPLTTTTCDSPSYEDAGAPYPVYYDAALVSIDASAPIF